MDIHRFIYLDVPGIASLYAQLHGKDTVETLLSVEHSRASGWKLAISAFLGGSGETGKSTKRAETTKVVLRPENMVGEIVSKLRARNSLRDSIAEAVAATASGATWFEAHHEFSVPPQIEKFNEMRAVVFLSGFPPYVEPSPRKPKITMSAGPHHFPSARDGMLSISGHEAMFFRSLNGSPYSYSVFGSIFTCGDGFQVKPYAIHL